MGNCCDCGQATHDSHNNGNFNLPYQSTEPIMDQPGPNRDRSNENKRKRRPVNSPKERRKSKRISSGNSNLKDKKRTIENENEPTSSLKEDHPIKRKNLEDNKEEQEKKPRLDEETPSDIDNPFIEKLNQIRDKAFPFIEEIEKFTELEDSNKYYYIEESLRRLIEKLDNMYDDLKNNSSLRAKRKEVYKYIFPLFDKLDDKVQENKDRIAQNNKSSI